MATGNFVLDKGFRVASGQQITKYRAVKLSAAETITPITAATDRIIGVAQNGVTTAELARGKGCDVRMMGISVCEAAGAVGVGDVVQLSGTAGQVIGGTPTSGNGLVGIALTAATNSGDRCTVFLIAGLKWITGE